MNPCRCGITLPDESQTQLLKRFCHVGCIFLAYNVSIGWTAGGREFVHAAEAGSPYRFKIFLDYASNSNIAFEDSLCSRVTLLSFSNQQAGGRMRHWEQAAAGIGRWYFCNGRCLQRTLCSPEMAGA